MPSNAKRFLNANAARQFWPVAALLAVIVAFFVFGPDNRDIFEALREYRQEALDYIARNAVVAGVAYVVLYALAIAFSLPGGAMMTIAGSFLFGWMLTATYVVFAATAGATALFLVARTAVGDRLRARAGPWMRKMEAGFQENALSYLLFLRLVPLFPFFVINLVPAFLGVSVRTYVIGTFFGIIPGTIVFSLAGGGLGSALDAGGDFSVSAALTPEIIAALVGLAVLALSPVVYKRVRARRS